VSNNCENLAKISQYILTYLVGYAIFCRIVSKVKICHLVISWFTEPNFIKFVQTVPVLLPINTLETKLRYFNPFQNASVTNKDWFANFVLKLVALATSLKRSEKEVLIGYIRPNNYHLMTKIVKIGPVGPDVIGLQKLFLKTN